MPIIPVLGVGWNVGGKITNLRSPLSTQRVQGQPGLKPKWVYAGKCIIKMESYIIYTM